MMTSGMGVVRRGSVGAAIALVLGGACHVRADCPYDPANTVSLDMERNEPLAYSKSLRVFNLYWSDHWDSIQGNPSQADLNAATQALLNSHHFDKLCQYGVRDLEWAGATDTDHGSPCPKNPVTQMSAATISEFINCEESASVLSGFPSAGGIPSTVLFPHPSCFLCGTALNPLTCDRDLACNTTANGTGDLFVNVFIPADIELSVILGDCVHSDGFHIAVPSNAYGYPFPFAVPLTQGRPIYISVIPVGCNPNALDFLMAVVSHEMVEALTDPFPSQFWWDTSHQSAFSYGEVADICQFATRSDGSNFLMSGPEDATRCATNADCNPAPDTPPQYQRCVDGACVRDPAELSFTDSAGQEQVMQVAPYWSNFDHGCVALGCSACPTTANVCRRVASCDASTGICSEGDPPACSDSNACTLDSCTTSAGQAACTACAAAGAACTDSGGTNAGTCSAGSGSACFCNLPAGCRHGSPVASCDPAGSSEALVGGPHGLCENGDTDPSTGACTIRTPSVDVTIAAGGPESPTRINVMSLTPAIPGACDFALGDSRANVAACFQFEPSGGSFSSAVTATFKWKNTAGAACNDATCCVSATGPKGVKFVKEGNLQLITQGRCLPNGPSGKCETTNALCRTDADCWVPVAPSCGAKQPAASQCPSCPGTGCLAQVLPYVCTPPCAGAALCDPAANSWTAELLHFSQYAIADVPPPPHDFQCYETRRHPISSPALAVEDAFGPSMVTVSQAANLCAPADHDGEDPTAATLAGHLMNYDITQAGAFARVRGIQVTTRFGTAVVDAVRLRRLMVPSAKSLTGPPAALVPPLDHHFKCYKVVRSLRAPAIRPRGVETTTDQFGTTQTRLQRPLELCLPAGTSADEGVPKGPGLLCFKERPGRFAEEVAFVSNEIGPQDWHLIRRTMLCVPSYVTVPTTSTATTTTVTSTTTPVIR